MVLQSNIPIVVILIAFDFVYSKFSKLSQPFA